VQTFKKKTTPKMTWKVSGKEHSRIKIHSCSEGIFVTHHKITNLA